MGTGPERPSPTTEPVATSPDHSDGIFGRRIAAAFLDLALLLALFVILGLPLGEGNLGGGGPLVSLSGAGAALYVAMVFLYCIALEAAIGQTVGERLLGLRVVGPDGCRPSASAIAVRTLFRVVEGCRFCIWSRCWPRACVADGSATSRPRPGVDWT